MSNLAELRLAVVDTLEAVSPLIESTSKLQWSPRDGMLPLVRSAILRRQYECLRVAAELVDKSQGFAAVGLLRPACEEFLWVKYFSSIAASDVELLLTVMARKEVSDSLKAQDDHAGRRISEDLGLAPYLKRNEASSKQVNTQIKALGKKLKWEQRTVEASKLPSVAFIAKAVGETKLYRLLYHASSRYVHFSPAELLRRAWGKTGDVSIDSMHFNNYWSSFVLYWGVFLMASTFPLAASLGDFDSLEGLGGEKLLAAAARIGAHGAVPIITSEELAWEPAPSR